MLLGKTHIPHYKRTASLAPEAIEPPKEVLLPTAQHIGAPAAPIVKPGDEVKVGQKIAEAQGYVSSPVFASVSGKVAKIEDYLRPDGRKVPAIRILSDGAMTPIEGLTPPEVNDLDSLSLAAKESGIVGLGGAGFPTAVKLDGLKKGNIDTVILNGAECEPYITSDTRTMLDEGEWIRYGIDTLRRLASSVTRFIIGIEKNKPLCIERMKELFADSEDVKVATLPSTYPQGGEKVLIYNTTGRIVKEGKLPSDANVLVLNVTTLASLAKYLKTGMPLVERTVTLDGSAVDTPKNITAPIGTPIAELLRFAGVDEEKIGKILFGGPMMGISVCSPDEPITKTTNAITVLNHKDAKKAEPTACIHCGRCVSACPLNLNPTAYAKALCFSTKEERVERLLADKINLCMECGCCSYVCPANRPLVQNNRIGKAEVREYQAHLATKKS